MKLSGIVELLFLYHSGKFHICISFPVAFMNLQMSIIGCVNYAHFPKSSHIIICMYVHMYVCMYVHMYVLWSHRPSVLSTDQLWVIMDKWCWVLYIDCVSLTPSVSLDAYVLATTAALQNSMFPLLYIFSMPIYAIHCMLALPPVCYATYACTICVHAVVEPDTGLLRPMPYYHNDR